MKTGLTEEPDLTHFVDILDNLLPKSDIPGSRRPRGTNHTGSWDVDTKMTSERWQQQQIARHQTIRR